MIGEPKAKLPTSVPYFRRGTFQLDCKGFDIN